jgi:hypothetical protein
MVGVLGLKNYTYAARRDEGGDSQAIPVRPVNSLFSLVNYWMKKGISLV